MDQSPITLDHPYTSAAGAEVKAIPIRRYTAGERRAALRPWGDDPAEQELALIAHLAEMIPEDLDGMDSADYLRVQAAFCAVSAPPDDLPVTGPIPLRHPVEVAQGTLSQVSLRRCTVGDQRHTQRQFTANADREAALLSLLTDLPIAVIDALDAADYGALLARFQGQFLRAD